MTSPMNNRLFITSIVIVAILLLHGCGAVRENRIRQEVLADANMSAEIRKAIDQKELVAGMTKEQVIASWGLPCKWCYGTRKSPSGDTWEYVLFGSNLPINGSDIIGIGKGIYLFFDSNGTLKHWSNQ
ncbi:outer membrane protein assembly factor BamE [Nitrosomonas sp. Nm84]|nr:outer membrane protein assembly factor BamE [Nitrosomonas sp. Nm84]